ncbi:ATP-binding protein [Pinisolibacter sp.]|uniref:ATP-binding protein n=1 Tax=Pinisolibacter sp. TaxID=2172024 RepID=UPI002FDD9B9A
MSGGENETATTMANGTKEPGAARGAGTDGESRNFAELAALSGAEAGMVAVIDALDDPCVLIDAGGIVAHVNAEARARYPGVRPGDPLVFRLRFTVLHDAFARVVAEARPETVEWQEKVPTDRWLEAHLAPIHRPVADGETDAGPPSWVLLRIEDLTETRRVERMRADFVANASHELRTPLTAVIGFLETLQGPARDDAKVRDRFLGVMAEQAGRMKRLIDDLLSLSRLEMRAHVRPEATVDLCEILRQVADLVSPAASAAGVDLQLFGCETPRTVRGDREELLQVFTNLIENGVKYGGSGGRVEVTVATDPADARLVVATVRDFGEGIDPVHLPRLTERFYRAHTEKAGATRGTGLGLAIVKHIVTRHGGRLTIESVPGEGSTFSVRLDRRVIASAKSEDGQ